MISFIYSLFTSTEKQQQRILNTLTQGTEEEALALIEELPPKAFNFKDEIKFSLPKRVFSYKRRSVSLALVKKLPPEMLNIPDPAGDIPLSSYVGNPDYTELALALIAKLPPEMLAFQSKDHDTLLHNCCFNPDWQSAEQIFHALISKAPSDIIDAQNQFGKTPLLLAAEKGHFTAIRLLLERGADPTIKDKEGISPLQEAKSPEIRRLLIENGASLHGITPVNRAEKALFHQVVAAKMGDLEVTDLPPPLRAIVVEYLDGDKAPKVGH